MMKSKKTIVPGLPGQYARMTRDQLDRESDRYDVEFSATDAERMPNRRRHPRKRGRPAKPPGTKAARVLITIDPELLAAADAAADRNGLTRAGLIQRAVADWLRKARKSA